MSSKNRVKPALLPVGMSNMAGASKRAGKKLTNEGGQQDPFSRSRSPELSTTSPEMKRIYDRLTKLEELPTITPEMMTAIYERLGKLEELLSKMCQGPERDSGTYSLAHISQEMRGLQKTVVEEVTGYLSKKERVVTNMLTAVSEHLQRSEQMLRDIGQHDRSTPSTSIAELSSSLRELQNTCREVKNAVQNEKGTTIHSTSFSILSRIIALDKSCKGIGAALETGGDKCIGSLLQHFRDETNEALTELKDKLAVELECMRRARNLAKEKLQKKEEELAQLQTRHKDLERNTKQIEYQLQMYRDNSVIKRVQQENSELRKKLEGTNIKMRSKEQQKEHEIGLFRQTATKKDREIATCKKTCSELQSQLEQESKKSEALQQQIATLVSDAQSREEAIQKKKQEYADLWREKQASDYEKDSFESQCIELKSQTQRKDQEIAMHQRRCDEIAADLKIRTESFQQQMVNLNEKVQHELSSLQEQLRQKEQDFHRPEDEARDLVASFRAGSSAAADMQIQQGGDHDQLLTDFESLATDPDGILGILEQHLDPYDAKVLLCEAFQNAYNKSKKGALSMVYKQLQKLFTKHGWSDMMDYTSRAYGMLLHATSARKKEVEQHYIRNIIKEVYAELSKKELFQKFEAKLSAGHPQLALSGAVNEIVRQAWRFVTLHSPLVVCQPPALDRQVMDKETLHWDDNLQEYVLVYTDSVVYRSYHGTVARKGSVGNAPMPCFHHERIHDLHTHEQPGPHPKTSVCRFL